MSVYKDTSQTIYTKLGDTLARMRVNMDLTGSTIRVLVKQGSGPVTVLPSTIVDATLGRISAQTSSLAVGTYDLEVEVTQGGVIATFPDQGYSKLVVGQDLG